MKHITINLLACSMLIISCNKGNTSFDASGTFEATEIIVSSEANGKILALNIDEGQELQKGQLVGWVDSLQLHLSKLQLVQNQKAILSSRPETKTQLESLQKELDNALLDQKRIENLVKGDVASQKQLDDANTRVTMLQSRMEALKSTLNTTTTTINEQGGSVTVQLAEVEDLLKKCNIINPINGIVLTRYANAYEMTAIGKPLYKIADLSEIILRAYITADQFSKVKPGDKVKVTVDAEAGKTKSYDGIVEWINNKAEFTPKTIQTKDERANLVYAIKIKVKNDGTLKIGMYGEVSFNK